MFAAVTVFRCNPCSGCVPEELRNCLLEEGGVTLLKVCLSVVNLVSVTLIGYLEENGHSNYTGKEFKNKHDIVIKHGIHL